ncbi:uncharacterized protein VTP21DRAFT_11437 [Calcarisporiella thermophila]|uniref:uncharacterized protein n=1 Tax=Calcarisporiella thermophila TaxID=911321 RepID=UPI003743BBFD
MSMNSNSFTDSGSRTKRLVSKADSQRSIDRSLLASDQDSAAEMDEAMSPIEFTPTLLTPTEVKIEEKNPSKCIDHNLDWTFLLTPEGLRFQLNLNTLTDLRRLLLAHFVTENGLRCVTIPNCTADAKQELLEIPLAAPRCTVFHATKEWGSMISGNLKSASHAERDRLRKSDDTKLSARTKSNTVTTNVYNKIMDFLFNLYAATKCVYLFHHPSHSVLLERYYQNKLHPLLIHSGIAWGAVHFLHYHKRTSYHKHLPSLIEPFLAKARAAVEDAFDEPNWEIVLGLLNMEFCERSMMRWDQAYEYHRLAVVMAQSLGCGKEELQCEDLAETELRKRIWYSLCVCETTHVMVFSKSPLINLKSMAMAPRPTLMPGEDEEVELLIFNLTTCLDFYFKFASYPDIEWSLPDHDILSAVTGIAALLRQDLLNVRSALSEEKASKYHWVHVESESGFWVNWGAVWRRFLESNAPPGRLETPLMAQLKEIAIRECVKASRNAICMLEYAIRLNNWCRFNLVNYCKWVCQISLVAARCHPSLDVKRSIFQLLLQCLQSLRNLPEIPCRAALIVISDVMSTLETMKNICFSKKELDKPKHKLRPIARKGS